MLAFSYFPFIVVLSLSTTRYNILYHTSYISAYIIILLADCELQSHYLLFINFLQWSSCITVETICTLSKEQTSSDILDYIVHKYGYILYYIYNNDYKKLEYVLLH